MTIQEFGRTIKKKYPQYQDMDDAELGKKMLQKYPQYQDMVQVEPVRAAQTTSTPKKASLGQRVGSFLKGEVMGTNKPSQSFTGSVFQSSVGSKGLLGVAQLPGKALAARTSLREQKDLSERVGKISQQTADFTKQRRQEQDPEKKARLTRLIDSNWKSIKELTDAREGLQSFSPTGKEALGTTVNALLTAYTGGSVGVAKAAGLRGAKALGVRALEQGAIGTGFSAGSALSENRTPSKGELLAGGVIGSAFPIGGAGAKAVKTGLQKTAGKLSQKFIGSIIKPTLNQLSYGKNPAGQVAREGIVANSLDDLVVKIRGIRDKVGNTIGQAMSKAEGRGVRLNLDGVMKPINEAIEAAKRNPRTNASALQRLYDVRDDLLRVTNDEAGNPTVGRKLTDISPTEAFNLKEDIAQLTKWTGNASDDKLVNKALQRVYSNTRQVIEGGVKGIGKLNERWGNLLSAEKAAERQVDIRLRQNIISLSTRITGVAGLGGVVASVLSGNPAPAIIGLGATGLQYVFSTPAAKTRLAKWLAKAGPKERDALYQSIPVMRNVIERIFGYDEADGIVPRNLKRSSGQSMYGVGAGIERDEEGNVGVSPTKAALGIGAAVAGGALLSRGARNATISRGTKNTRKRVTQQLNSQKTERSEAATRRRVRSQFRNQAKR